MIDRNGKLSISAQAKLLGISRGSVCYPLSLAVTSLTIATVAADQEH